MASSAPCRRGRTFERRERPSLHLEHREKGFLRDLDGSDLLHALLSLFLLLEELALAGDVAAVTLRENVFAERFHARASDDLVPNCRLNRDLEQLARNELLQFVGDFAAPLV